ncbi:MAG: ADP-ribosylation factor-like protein [Candidatus Freyarchaeota archaeon]
MERLKILVMGPTSAGKTSIIRQVIYGLESRELEHMEPTMLVKVHPDYKHGDYLCKFFDTGGQERMFEEYYRPEREGSIFSKVNIFIYVVDSGDASKIRLARKEFWRSIFRVTKYSPQAYPVVFAHKQDLKVHIPPDEVRNILIGPTGGIYQDYLPQNPWERKQVEKMVKRITVYGTSIMDPVSATGERVYYWKRSDEAVVEVIESYKRFLKESIVLGVEARKVYPEEFLNNLTSLLKDFDRILGSVGSLVLDKMNNFVIATTLKETVDKNAVLRNIIVHASLILEESEKSLPEAIMLRAGGLLIVLKSVSKEVAFLTALPDNEHFDEGELRRLVEKFLEKISEFFKTVS